MVVVRSLKYWPREKREEFIYAHFGEEECRKYRHAGVLRYYQDGKQIIVLL